MGLSPIRRSLFEVVGGKSPWEDDCSFAELLASHGVFVFPGTPQEIPGYFRISLTASEDMISHSLPKFQLALEYAATKPI